MSSDDSGDEILFPPAEPLVANTRVAVDGAMDDLDSDDSEVVIAPTEV